MVRAKIVVKGAVQGVGFRPFIHRLAKEHRLNGWVLNSTEGVVVEVEGEKRNVEAFVVDIAPKAPPLAVVEKVDTVFLPPVGYSSFVIQPSREGEGGLVLVSPDIATCPDCLRELLEPQDRRYRYPFTNCTNCGPRFTIIEGVPYDRPRTTMRAFTMCEPCESEYHDPADRRFHAQPNACPACGPRVWIEREEGNPGCTEKLKGAGENYKAIERARELLAAGCIIAVKGLGGFHLACDATNDEAVKRLRERKGRVDKPFALMSLDVEAVERYCYLSEGERQLLLSPQRPIVLLRRRTDSPISELVAPHNNYLGVMLPYTPLHYLLLSNEERVTSNEENSSLATHYSLPIALVMTSGNMSEEPIATDNADARERLSILADYFLMHDRPIHIRCDDSVTYLFEGKEFIIRRSRGYAPFPVRLPFQLQEILACGAELKNAFCLTKDTYAFMSQHIGDMENLETLRSYEASIEHFKWLFRVNPKIIAYDMHPDHLSTKYAQQAAGGKRQEADAGTLGCYGAKTLIPVQHHHAHIASCMAENGLRGRVIGAAFDGTGYGEDGRIWGGEFLVCDYAEFERVAHLAYVPLPGGEAAIRRPYRMALSHLYHAYGSLDLDLPLLRRIAPVELRVIEHQIETGLNSPLTSSMGRLFDAVSALIGVRDVINYEAQAAIELEMVAAEDVEEGYTIPLSPTPYPLVLDPAPLIRAIVADMKGGVDRSAISAISAKFHNGVAKMIAAVCGTIREREGLNRVVLSGGVFQNVYLLSRALKRLREEGFEVFIHHQVPTNDGGIALGQALVANAQCSDDL